MIEVVAPALITFAKSLGFFERLDLHIRIYRFGKKKGMVFIDRRKIFEFIDYFNKSL